MAKFFSKIVNKSKKLIEQNIKAKNEELVENYSDESDFDTSKQFEGMTKERAKAELERKIAEKLSSMPESDLTELLRISEKREKERLENVKRMEERRAKRAKTGKEKIEPIITENAVLADYHQAEQEKIDKYIQSGDVFEEIKIEGQVSMMELPRHEIVVPEPATSNAVEVNKLKEEYFEELEREHDRLITKQKLANDQSELEESIPLKSIEQTVDENISKPFSDIKESSSAIFAKIRNKAKKIDRELPFEEKATKFLEESDYITDKIFALIGKFFYTIFEPIKIVMRKFMKSVYDKNPELLEQRQHKRRKLSVKFKILRRKIVTKEKEYANRMVHFINHMDNKNEEIADKTTEIVTESSRKFNWAREWADINKQKLLSGFAIIIFVAIVGISFYNHFTAYEYAYNNRTLGMVKDQEDVLRIVDLVSEQLTKKHNATININKDEDITFKRVWSFHHEVDDMEAVLRRLTYMQNMTAKGIAIYIEGKKVAIVDNKKTAHNILDQVMSSYMTADENTEYEDVGFAESIKMKEVDTKLGSLMNPSDVVNKILTGAEQQKVHIVEAGETFSGIAKQYGMAQKDLYASNPNVTPEKLSIGQEIILTQAAPLLTVQTVEMATYIEAMPFTINYENNDKVYKGEQTTKVKGENGEREIVAKIVRNNGIEVAKMEISSKILKEPTSALIMVGTKDPPPLQGSGSFIYPVNGARLTSKFGTRWGRMHYGIDLACPVGTKIRAADGGTVTFAGYSGSYGYVVKINHGGNKTTVYAHCSKLFVSKGTRVYQGQHIANVGNTGRSTGPHCHFEIQVSGTPKNPLNYL